MGQRARREDRIASSLIRQSAHLLSRWATKVKTFLENAQLVRGFANPFCSGSLVRIEKLLEQLMFEHRAGMREQSVILTHSTESARKGNDVA